MQSFWRTETLSALETFVATSSTAGLAGDMPYAMCLQFSVLRCLRCMQR